MFYTLAVMPFAMNSLEQQRAPSKSLLDVRSAAKIFGVSTSWIRRHITELPAIRVGRFIHFDAELLSEQLRARIEIGKSLKPERIDMFFRINEVSFTKRAARQEFVTEYFGKMFVIQTPG